jgi:D-alanyl-D-alanine carboxypeptidase/D-alanyl-D-alanine-endopeptidase (penicillin-binding protein 4)
VLVCALVSIDMAVAQPQGSAGSGEGSAATAAPASPDDEESGSGGGSALVAPHDAGKREKWVTEKLAAAISSRPALAKAVIGVAVTDLASGKELFAKDADRGMNLASNTKLLTTVAALGTLGGGFRWRTAAYVDDLDEATGIVKGNLYVRGRGDPLLSPGDLRALATDIAAHGIRQVKGQLIVDTSYFDGDVEPPHYAEQPLERAGFRGPVASFGVARSTITVVVTAEPGGPAKVTLDPDPGDYVKITKAEVTTETTGRSRIKVDMKSKPDHLEIEVTGQIRAAGGSYEVRRRIDDPARFAAEVFKKALAKEGVHVARKAISIGTVPLRAKIISEHESPPLALVIRDMNKLSDNYIAETILKTLGAETRTQPGSASWADGLAAARAYLGKLGLGAYKQENGSGLYSASELSPHQLVKLLTAAQADYRIGPDLVASLPTGGYDGTLAKRWRGRAAEGRVRAKTGTLDKVVTLAGYVAVDGAHQIAFAILVNEIPPGQRGAVREMADEMVDVLVADLEATSP